jgi:RNA polymerase sigma-70 factor (ECF subfamily)
MDGVDDDLLLDRARRGNEQAFTLLFERHQSAIYGYAAYMCGPDAGDDIVQETFLAVLKQQGRHDPLQGTVASYLFGVARHLILKRLTHRTDAPFDELHEADLPAASARSTVLDDLTRAETIDRIRRAIRSLPEVYRELIVLCGLKELDYATVAALVECPIGTVRSRLSRAKALLAAKLADQAPLRRQA